MKINFTRMAVLAMAFGFLYSCAPVDHLQQAQNLKNSNRYSAALESANRAVDRTPENPGAHLLRAEVLAAYARSVEAGERSELYRQMVQSAEKALSLAHQQDAEETEARVLQLRSGAFNTEYEAALFYTSESAELTSPSGLLPALPHLENARIIQPGYEDLFEAMVNVYSANRMYDEAIGIMLEIQQAGSFDTRRHEILGFLFYQTEDYDRAIDNLQVAWMAGRGTANSGRGLANAYRKSNDALSEREVLEQLVEMEPGNHFHHLALGKNLMDDVFEKISELSTETNRELLSERLEESMQDAERVENLFETATQINQDQILSSISTGLYYRNLAFLLRTVHEAQPLLMSTEDLKAKTEDYLYKSLNHLERASELDPDQPLVWNALWPVYETLGMPDQARDARNKSNE